MEFYSDEIHKARKIHRCMLCGHNIEVGEKYHRQAGKYDGDFFDRCLHNECDKMIEEYCSETNENEFDESGVSDWLNDIYCYECDKEEDCEVNTFRCEKIVRNFQEVEE